MTLTHRAVTFDCADAATVSRFWSEVLDRPVDTTPMPASPHFASIGLTYPAGIAYMFIQVPEAKTVKNRVHLDLETDDIETEVARMVALGATIVHHKDEFGLRWTTLSDPEGNEFCVGAHHA